MNTLSKLHHGFLDESGILEKKAKEGSCFVISVMVVANPAEIKDVMKIARRKARGKFRVSSTFHAYKEGGVLRNHQKEDKKGKQTGCLGPDSHPALRLVK